MPVVDGGIELQARIGGSPGGITDLFPKVTGPNPAGDLSVGAPDQLPFAVVQDLFQKSVRDADGVIGILSGNGEVGFRLTLVV